jgi:acyl-CoA synthetase (AMP-forming)/AMP-acid ligase II
MHQPFDLPVFLKQATLEKATYTVAPPALLTLLLLREEILAQADISSMRVIGSGSAPLSPFMVKTWQVKYGIPVTNFFGSNEGIALLGDPAVIPDPEKRALYFPRFGADGFTFESRITNGMKTRLVHPDTGETLTDPGFPGEMRIQGPTVFSGYYNDPDLTAASFDEQGYYRTGDMFEIAGDNGEFYRYVDRLKDIIIRGGQNISAAEIEGHLQGHPKLIETAVIGYPDEVMGEKICVVAVVKPGETLTLQDLHDHLNAKHIASYKLPERIKVVPALPRNPVGKVLKRELRGN